VSPIPRQAAVWDESRNSSAVRPPAPGALRDALVAMENVRCSDPALAQWIEEGHPYLTEDDHVARFGEPSKPKGRR
jgi:hypothetical protein